MAHNGKQRKPKCEKESKIKTIHRKVGLAGFEPAASSSRTRRATKLRYSPLPVYKL